MRIIAGKYRHRIISMTNLDTTRETQDSVREAMFNTIGPYFDGGIALDLFCGSGALGIEAYSRGIEKIYLNDLEPKAISVVKKNLNDLKINDAYITSFDYLKAISFYEEKKLKFDYVFLDPPYRLNNIKEILNSLKNIINSDTLIVFEMANESDANVDGFKIIKEKKYGIKKIVYYKYLSE